jgi:short-subunit dehydrogenase
MKTVLITGASSGFGALMTLKFAREGYYVYATARDLSKEEVKRISDISTKEGLEVEWIKLDVNRQEDVDSAVKRVIENSGGLDVLINNAGFGILGPIQSYTIDDFQKQFDTNFFGVIRMNYAFLPTLIKSESGRIINISSIGGLIVAPAYGLYSSSKFALEAYTEALRYELFQTNVKVSLVEPGGFDTNFSVNAKGLTTGLDDEKSYDKWYRQARDFRNRFVGKYGETKSRGRNPQIVADRVFRISQMKNPRLHNLVGTGTPYTAFIRKIIPSSWWEFVAITILKLATR